MVIVFLHTSSTPLALKWESRRVAAVPHVGPFSVAKAEMSDLCMNIEKRPLSSANEIKPGSFHPVRTEVARPSR